ncbi:hypothetical protein [Paludisphaera rhizosphaerae]|uniref:hypothetical protein n=1 Tax=Paludisphaera rhizosphaerae TaxID=2711216 RepID=UPI0013EC9807|nr:hypothetical protein [Paludisphaera rhizosphaerae]
MRRILILLSVLLAAAPLLRASAAPAAGSPEAVVEKAFDALYHNRIPEFIQALHPDALKEFRSSILELLDLVAKKGHPEILTEAFQGVANAEELKKLDAAAMLTARFANLTSSPRVKMSWESTKVEAVGSVLDGQDRAYVVCRSKTTIGDVMIQRFSVVAARKSGEDWKMSMPDEFTGELALMKQSVAEVPKPPNFAATKFEPLGHVMDGKDAAMVVYRMETPVGETSLTRINVLRSTPDDPEWANVLKDEKAATLELLKRKVPLPQASDAR